MIVPLEEFAKHVERTPRAIRKAIESGRISSAAHRGAKNEWLIDLELGVEEFRRKTDTTRVTNANVKPPRKTKVEPAAPVVDPELIAAVNRETRAYLEDLKTKVLTSLDSNDDDFEVDFRTLEEMFAETLARWS